MGDRHAGRARAAAIADPAGTLVANLFDVPGVKLADMSPDLLTASSYLPGEPPSDPMDRIIAATARELGATLITRDRALLRYGAQGHVAVVEC
jgi:PIN domain nuclease of toxin-antitoxin system